MRPVLHANCPRGRLRRSVRTRCEVVRERDFKLVGTNVLDLSTRGMLLETDLSILTGEDLIVSFESPTSRRWYDCGATVARVLHGRRHRDEQRAVGVAFDSLHVLDELLLCEDLRSVPMSRRGIRTEPRRTW